MLSNRFPGTYPRLFIKIALDITAFLAAFVIAYFLRFNLDRFLDQLKVVLIIIPLIIGLRVVCFGLFRLYASMWRYSGTNDLLQIVKATSLSTVVIIVTLFFMGHKTLPRSILVTDWLLVIFFTGTIRLLVRKFHSTDLRAQRKRNSYKRVLIYGAGRAGDILIRNIESTREVKVNIVGFLDDNPDKRGHYIHNKKVLGDRTNLVELVKKYGISDIYLSIPSLTGIEMRELLRIIAEQVGEKVEIKTIPGLTDIVSDRITYNELRKIEIKDLLRRKPVQMNFAPVRDIIKQNTVLVVGGGGSIGMELCRQIAAFNPARLLVLDISEFNLYNAERSIQDQYPNLKLIPIVADAANEPLMRRILGKYKPSLLFHAAAYKHVPLMEMNPYSAVQNNLTCTLTLAKIAIEQKVDRFILISTDKAVQPTSVMGATKRICEIIARTYHLEDVTKFIVVRFGNVLGSSGSVIPKFRDQIEKGGPITVTHPEITRYFMLISEAVELVLQAGAIGESGNIYVLDMGKPISILDLARYMIELSGLKENEDIKIVFIGLRPGEKLHESLYFEGEESATRVPNLLVLEPKIIPDRKYMTKIHTLLSKLYDLNDKELALELKQLAPEYQPNKLINGYTNNIQTDSIDETTPMEGVTKVVVN